MPRAQGRDPVWLRAITRRALLDMALCRLELPHPAGNRRSAQHEIDQWREKRSGCPAACGGDLLLPIRIATIQ